MLNFFVSTAVVLNIIFNMKSPESSSRYPVDSIDTIKLNAEINKLLIAYPDVVLGLAFKDFATGESYFQNAQRSFHAASTMKTPVMLSAFVQMDRRQLSLDDSLSVHNEFKSIIDGSSFSLSESDDSEKGLYRRIGSQITLRELLKLMITQSSNLATNLVIERIGTDVVNEALRNIGVTGMQVLRGVEDTKAFREGLNNQTNAADLLRVFEVLGSGRELSASSTKQMLSILEDQQFRDKIPALLPEGIRTATKSGFIAGINHDSGIIFLPDGRSYGLVLLSEGFKTQKEAAAVLSRISRMIYDQMLKNVK